MRESEKAWRADYGAVWQYAKPLKKQIEAKRGKEKITVYLPAFREPAMEYTLKEFYGIITNRDDYFAFSHLQYLLFSLLYYLLLLKNFTFLIMKCFRIMVGS